MKKTNGVLKSDVIVIYVVSSFVYETVSKQHYMYLHILQYLEKDQHLNNYDMIKNTFYSTFLDSLKSFRKMNGCYVWKIYD